MIFKDASSQKWVLIGLGTLTLLIIILELFARAKRTQRAKNRKDERYLLLSAKASQLAYFTFLGWAAVYFLICLIANRHIMANGLCMLTGIVLSVCADFTYCVVHEIWRDERFDAHKFPWGDFICGLLFAWNAILSLKRGEMTRNGVLQYDFIRVLAAIFYIYRSITVLIKRSIDKRADREDEE